jgi:CheY-like chemotaxis protein
MAQPIFGPSPHRIIIVDDDPISCYLTEIVCKKHLPDTEIHVFNDGDVFMQKYEAYQREDVVVFLDLNMPRKDGFDCLEEMSRLPKTPPKVIILTSSVRKEDRKRAFSYPMVVDYLEKPLEEHNTRVFSQP